MSTASYPRSEIQRRDLSVPADPIFRLSVEQYHEMIRKGILTDDDKVELLEGLLIPKMSKNPASRVANELAAEALRAVIPAGWYVTSQEPMTTSTSEPEPDVSVVEGRPRDYINGHPGPENLALVVEISDSSISRDRGIKCQAYALAGVSIYWILDIAERRVEVRTNPSASAGQAEYATIHHYCENEMIPVSIRDKEVGRIAVRDMLP
jgi:Uma2 family endonuclease